MKMIYDEVRESVLSDQELISFGEEAAPALICSVLRDLGYTTDPEEIYSSSVNFYNEELGLWIKIDINYQNRTTELMKIPYKKGYKTEIYE